MANQPLLKCVVNITAPDINGNSVLKRFLAVTQLKFDYSTGRLFIQDVTGAFYFGLTEPTTVTYAITGSGVNAITTVTIT